MESQSTVSEIELTSFKEGFDRSGAHKMVALDREGNEIEILSTKEGATGESADMFPVVIERYAWNRDDQIKGAKEFRDRIEYLYYPEQDDEHPMLPVWRLDDTARLEATLKLPFGKKVLESGCSSGTVTIEIAKLNGVEEVWGNDLRDDAIGIAKDLVKDLSAQGKLTEAQANKITFKVSAAEDLKNPGGLFDTVCAFEMLEHLVPDDFDTVVTNIIRLMKPDGNFLVSVPNRYPDEFYEREGRSRWSAPDHKNFFSKASMEFLLQKYFNSITFYPVDERSVDKGVYLMCACGDRKI